MNFLVAYRLNTVSELIINHFFAGHFLLTNLLLDVMKSTAAESNVEGRIVVVSSLGHRFVYKEGIQFDKINVDTR